MQNQHLADMLSGSGNDGLAFFKSHSRLVTAQSGKQFSQDRSLDVLQTRIGRMDRTSRTGLFGNRELAIRKVDFAEFFHRDLQPTAEFFCLTAPCEKLKTLTEPVKQSQCHPPGK